MLKYLIIILLIFNVFNIFSQRYQAFDCLEADKSNVDNITFECNKKVDKIKTNLQTSKNYKQAQLQLNSVDDLFNNHPEIVAIKKNYNDFTEEDNFKRELVKSGVLALTKYEEWKKKVLVAFEEKGGTNYNPDTKKYTSIKKIIESI